MTARVRLMPFPEHAPVAYASAEPDDLTPDELAAVVVEVLTRVAFALGVDEQHVVRCAGCGDWAWDERPCSTCAKAAARRRRGARGAA